MSDKALIKVTDLSKVSSAGAFVKDSIYEFLDSSEKIVFVVFGFVL